MLVPSGRLLRECRLDTGSQGGVHTSQGEVTPVTAPWVEKYETTAFQRRSRMAWIEDRFEKSFVTTTVDYVFNWARKSAIWPMTFGLACCAIEMMAASASRFDIAR